MLPDMSPTRRRRPAVLTALALLLAVESVTTVAVRAAEITDARSQAAAVAAAPVVSRGIARATVALRPPLHDARVASDAVAASTAVVVRVRVDPVHRSASAPRPDVRARTLKPKAAKPSSGTPRARTSPPAHRGQLVGRDHVWSPALGIDKRVYSFPCSRAQKPGNVVYRWGCAGRNNVYLMGHAANVFGSLNGAYYDGRLRRGLKVYYADPSGKV